MIRKRILTAAILVSGAAILSFTPARAGFEWKGPIEPPAMAESPAPAPVETLAAAPAQAPILAPAPVAPSPLSETGEVLTGFGTDIPLVMALQQIVPPGYQFSFAQGINPGTPVSWQGGKPWQGVLTDTLTKAGLGYHLQGNAVIVDTMASAPPAAAPMPAPVTASAGTNAPIDITAPANPPEPAAPGAYEPNDIIFDTPPAASAAGAQKQETVTIRRKKEKKPSLLERLGFKRHKDEDSAEADEQPAAAQPENNPPQASAEGQASPAASAPSQEPPVMTSQLAAGGPLEPAAESAAAPVKMASAGAAASPSSVWTGAKGQTLRDVLKAWSDKAGVELYWSIDYDYRLGDDVSISGAYDQAVGGLLDRFAQIRPQPYGQLHQGSQGPRVLVIKSYDLAQ